MNGPLDVIRTRLALEEFGNRPTRVPRTLASEYLIFTIIKIDELFSKLDIVKLSERKDFNLYIQDGRL